MNTSNSEDLENDSLKDFRSSNEFRNTLSAKSQQQTESRQTTSVKKNRAEVQVPLLEGETSNAEPAKLQKEEKRGCFKRLYYCFAKEPVSTTNRMITFEKGVYPTNRCKNIIRNQKYSIFSFIPLVLYNQFKFFFNFFFLAIALSQFIDILKVGLLFSYVAPLAFVLTLTMAKEAFDDFNRFKQDKEANSQRYQVFTSATDKINTPSSALKVGDIIEVHANQRVPADLLLLYTTDESGTVFLRTDQLDGETDWKLRKPVHPLRV